MEKFVKVNFNSLGNGEYAGVHTELASIAETLTNVDIVAVVAAYKKAVEKLQESVKALAEGAKDRALPTVRECREELDEVFNEIRYFASFLADYRGAKDCEKFCALVNGKLAEVASQLSKRNTIAMDALKKTNKEVE